MLKRLEKKYSSNFIANVEHKHTIHMLRPNQAPGKMACKISLEYTINVCDSNNVKRYEQFRISKG